MYSHFSPVTDECRTCDQYLMYYIDTVTLNNRSHLRVVNT